MVMDLELLEALVDVANLEVAEDLEVQEMADLVVQEVDVELEDLAV